MNQLFPFQWISAAATHVGKVRTINEDAFLERAECGLWAVADGMGGHHAGDVASRTIVEQLAAVQSHVNFSALVDEVEQRLFAANRLMHDLAAGQQPPTVMGSTVAVLLAHRRHCLSMWAGDSRVYRLRAGTLQQITRDHSQIQQWVTQGFLSEEEADRHPAANIVTRAVGAEPLLHLDMELRALEEGDRYLVCSDGLYRELAATELEALLARGKCSAACQALIDAALARRARDNLTALVVDFFTRV